MKQIKELAGHIEEELHDARKYIETALMYKDSDRELADMYADLSREEINHAHMEHEQAVRLIRAQRTAPPAEMLAVWDYLHKRHVENEAEVKRLQAMYKE